MAKELPVVYVYERNFCFFPPLQGNRFLFFLNLKNVFVVLVKHKIYGIQNKIMTFFLGS